MKTGGKWLLIIMFFFVRHSYANENITVGRKVIKSLEKEIREFIKFSDYELVRLDPDKRDEYNKVILPRINNISVNIADNAIRWVDFDDDENPELIFWTEGLAGDTEMVKEFIFVIAVENSSKFNKKPKNHLMLIRQLNPIPSRGKKNYEYSRFRPRPNSGRGYNNFLTAIFSYGVFGVTANNFVNYEIFWNRHYNKIDISEFFTSFPVAVEKNESLEKSNKK